MENLFRSFLLGGFECSTHRRRDGRRLDLIRASRHDEFAREDYERLRARGICAARDGIRWHRIETRPSYYDRTSALPMLRAARNAGVQVIWDLCHYGWPDDLDLFSPAFVDRFAAFARAFARILEALRLPVHRQPGAFRRWPPGNRADPERLDEFDPRPWAVENCGRPAC